MPTARTAESVAAIEWVEDGRRARFASSRGYGVRQGDTFLSFNGVCPSVWTLKRTAQEIADTLVDDGSLAWIPVIK